MEWISVKDKIIKSPCLLFWDDKRMTIVENELSESDINYMTHGNPDFRVTHWQPLPEPPK